MPLWICEDCGGPASWTFIRGVAHYHCKNLCTGFRQVDMFDTSEYVDKVVSVSALEDEGENTDLPF